MKLISTAAKKSIPPFIWAGIPQFAVLVGKNGSGKSQLLETLESGTVHQRQNLLNIVGPITFDPPVIKALRLNCNQLQLSSAASATDFKADLNNIDQLISNTVNQESLEGNIKQYLTKILIGDTNYAGFNGGTLSRYFNVYYFSEINFVKTKEMFRLDIFLKLFGNPPWQEINSKLKEFKVKFNLVSPNKKK